MAVWTEWWETAEVERVETLAILGIIKEVYIGATDAINKTPSQPEITKELVVT